MYVTDKFGETYWHHFGAQMQERNPNVTPEQFQDYIRRKEQEDPKKVLEMGDYLYDNAIRGLTFQDGKTLSREEFDTATGITILRDYTEQGPLSRGAASAVENIKRGLASAAEGLGKVTGIEGLEKFGARERTEAEAELARIRPETPITEIDSIEDAGNKFLNIIGSGVIDLGFTGAGSVVGAAVGLLGGPAAPVTVPAGAIVGGLLANFPLFYGLNREAQKEQKKKEGQTEADVNEGRAAGTAIAQAAIDYFAEKLLLGPFAQRGISKMLTAAGKKPTRAAVQKVQREAQSKLRSAAKRIGKAGGLGAVEEGLISELSQQVLERWQAKAPLTDKEALNEYLESIVAGGIIGGMARGGIEAVVGETPAGPPPTEGTTTPGPTTDGETQPSEGLTTSTPAEPGPEQPQGLGESPPAVEPEEAPTVGPPEEVQEDIGPPEVPIIAKDEGVQTVWDHRLRQDVAAGERQLVEGDELKALKTGDKVLLNPPGETDPIVANVGEVGENYIRFVDDEGEFVGGRVFGAPNDNDPQVFTTKPSDIEVDEEAEKEAEKVQKDIQKEEEKVQKETEDADRALVHLEGNLTNKFDVAQLKRFRQNPDFYKLPEEKQKTIEQALLRSETLIEEKETKAKEAKKKAKVKKVKEPEPKPTKATLTPVRDEGGNIQYVTEPIEGTEPEPEPEPGPSPDDYYEVMDASYEYGVLGEQETVPTATLSGGVRTTDNQAMKRAGELAAEIKESGRLDRIIVDTEGNVIEGQHRLEAARILGIKQMPVQRIIDLSKVAPVKEMAEAVRVAGKLHPEQAKQLAQYAAEAIQEEGGNINRAEAVLNPGAYRLEYAAAFAAARGVKTEPQPEPETKPTPKSDFVPLEGVKLGKALSELGTRMQTEGFRDIREARKFVSELTGQEILARTPAAKDAEEMIEGGVVIAAHRTLLENLDPGEKFDRLSELYARQPILGTREAESARRQAYSTPIHIAYAAAQIADVATAESVLEPTAGNGALLVTADPDAQRVTVNEIDNKRAATLRAQGFTVNQLDAADPTTYEAMPEADVVIANPPFGILFDYESRRPRKWTIPDKVADTPFVTDQIDHAVALYSLEKMKDDGRAVLIVGSVSKQDEDRNKAYQDKHKREFYWRLYNQYNVVDHFTLPGETYTRQGSGWPIDIIVIEGRGKSARPFPVAEPPPVIDLAQLREKVVSHGVRRQADQREGGLPPTGDVSGDETKGSERSDAGDLGPTEIPGEGTPARPDTTEATGPSEGPVLDQPRPDMEDDRTIPGPPKRKPRKSKTGTKDVRGRVGEDGVTENIEPKVPVQAPVEPIGTTASTTGATNTIFTQDAYQAARKRMLEKMGRKSTGFDPELLQDGLIVAGYHLEAGVRKFSAFTHAMINDMGENIRPYLKSLYNGVRDFPDVTFANEMDSHEVVSQEVTSWTEQKQEAPPEAQTEPGQTTEADDFLERMMAGEKKVPNKPISKNKPISTLVPAMHASAARNILAKLGIADVDAFVMTELQYGNKAEFEKAFAAEQVDALAMAIANAQSNQGFINGDMTGVGKGRFMAGMIRYAIISKRIPVFVTANKILYADMWRDMLATGLPEFLGHNPNPLATDIGASSAISVEDKEGNEVVIGGRGDQWLRSQYGQIVQNLGAEDPLATQEEKFDMIFTTYYQVQSQRGQMKARHNFLKRIIPNSFLLMDESHKAGGTTKAGAREPAADKSKVSRSDFMFDLTANATGAVFASATFAKNPYVMSFYASKTNLGYLASRDDRDTFAAIAYAGGLPFQQIVSQQLVGDGQYLRRELDFEGVTVDNRVATAEKGAYEKFLNANRELYTWDVVFAQKIRERFITGLATTEGAGAAHDPSLGDQGATQTNFASLMHNLVKVMMVSIKADQAAEAAIESWKQGQKPIVAADSTLEAALVDLDLKKEEQLDLPFGVLIRRYLARTLRVTQQTGDGRKVVTAIPLSFLTQAELAQYEGLYKEFSKMALPLMPVSPLDWVLHRMRSAGMKVGEITGRSVTFDYTPPTGQDASVSRGTLKDRAAAERSAQGKKKTVAEYNGGELDGLIMNRSAAEGISMHSSIDFKDQRQRSMFIIDAPPNIDDYIQIIGRVNRVGQVNKPIYVNLLADIPAEKRATAMLMNRLKTLNANVTADQESEFTHDKVVEFINDFGDEVVHDMFDSSEWSETALYLGVAGLNDAGSTRLDPVEDFARRVTGKSILLPLADQERMYSEIAERFTSAVERALSAGINPFGIDVLDYRAEEITSSVLVPASNEESTFGGEVRATRQKVRVVRKPYKQETVVRHVYKAHNKEFIEGLDLNESLEAMAEEEAERVRDNDRTPIFDDLSAYLKAFRSKVDTEPSATDKTELIAKKTTEINQAAGTFFEYVSHFAPGHSVEILAPGQLIPTRGIITKVPQWNTKNPNRFNLSTMKTTIALLDPIKEMSFGLHELVPVDGDIMSFSSNTEYAISHQSRFNATMTIVDAFQSYEGAETKEIDILTGNVAKAAMEYLDKGKLVVFTTATGEQNIGLEMKPDRFDLREEATKTSRLVSKPDDVPNILRYLSSVSESGNGTLLLGDDAILKRTEGSYVLSFAQVFGSRRRGQAQSEPIIQDNMGHAFRLGPNDKYNPFSNRSAWQFVRGHTLINDENLIGVIRFLVGQGRKMEVALEDLEAYEAWKGQGSTKPRQRRISPMALDMSLPDSIIGRIYEAAHRILPQGVTVEIVSDSNDGAVGSTRSGDDLKPIISVAMAGNPLGTLNHEVIHALFAMGMFSPKEQTILRRAADRGGWISRHNIRTIYEDLSESETQEEAIAESFAHWENGLTNPPTFLTRLFRRIHEFFGQVVTTLHAERWFPTTAAVNIFGRISRGKFARAEAAGALRPTTRYRRIEQEKGLRDTLRDFLKERGEERADEIADRIDEGFAGVKPRGMSVRAKETLRSGWQSMARRWASLPENQENATLIEQLRILSAADDVARGDVQKHMAAFAKGLTEEDIKHLTATFVMRDFLWTADKDMELPFGLSKDKPDLIAATIAHLESKIQQNPVLRERDAMHRAMLKDLRQNLVSHNVLPEERLRNEDYFMHQVMEFAQIESDIQAQGGKKTSSPHYYRRQGSESDINLNYSQVWSKVLFRAHMDVATADFLSWLDTSKYNKHREYRGQAQSDNAYALASQFHDAIKAIVGEGAQLESVAELEGATHHPTAYTQTLLDLFREKRLILDTGAPSYAPVRRYMDFSSQIAWGFADLARAIHSMDADMADKIPSRYHTAIEQIQGGVQEENDQIFPFMGWLVNKSGTDLGALQGAAARILSASSRRAAWAEEQIGDKFIDPDDVKALIKNYGEGGQGPWQADSYDGKTTAVHMFFARTISERVYDRMAGRISELAMEGGEVQDAVVAIKEFLDRTLPRLVVGGAKKQMILDNGVIGALDNFRDRDTEVWIEKITGPVTRAWKAWTLFNLSRFARYITNNFTSDIGAIAASGYGKAVFGRLGQANKELSRFLETGEATPLLKEANRRAVMLGGPTAQHFEFLLPGPDSEVDRAASTLGRAGRAVIDVPRRLAMRRESIFRYAAFLAMHDAIVVKGQDPAETGYGATPPHIIAGLKGMDLATRMSIDLMGDYWVSQGGRWLRKHMIPFWSWQESNAVRYVNLIKNVALFARTKSLRSGLVPGAAAAGLLAYKLALVHIGYTLWNKLFFGDEEEELTEFERTRPHIILGRTPSGQIIKTSPEFGLTDFLEWFGYEGAWETFKDVLAGRAGVADILKEVAKAAPNRLVNSINPLYKTLLVEIPMGKQLWPDMFSPRTIQDRFLHIANMLSLKGLYVPVMQAFGHPMTTPGMGERLLSLATVDIKDPGEQAYLATRSKAYNWLRREKGQSGDFGKSGEMSQLFYYWRRAIRHKRQDVASEIKKMIQGQILKDTGRLENPMKRLKRSLHLIRPLGMLSKRNSKEFLETLGAREKADLLRARRWFRDTYGTK